MPMDNSSVTKRLSAILAADIVGYTRLMEADSDGTVAAWQAARSGIIDPSIEKYAGRIVKHTGDGFLAEFPTVQSAVECAVAMQDELSANSLEFRMGVNLGDIIDDGEDIHGEGVNIAARIEALAEAGGISISGGAYEQVRNRVDDHFEDTGEHDVKHVSAPVRVYRIVKNPTSLISRPSSEPAVSDKPSIAVLPFDNMSGDPEQEYFSDGMTEDIITALSRIRQLFVMARNTSFTFKGRSVDVQLVAQQLDVRYILEGSVRKSGNRVRITAQLINGATGDHLWAKKYDATLDDIFVLQDEITESVVGAIEPTLRSSEIERSLLKPTTSLSAYDFFLRALPHAYSMTQDGNEEALRLTSKAIELDPRYASAMSLAAWCYTLRVAHGWANPTQNEVEKALQLARSAIEIDKDLPENLWLAGYVLGFFGDTPKEGIDIIDNALQLNPNASQALVYGAWLRVYNGDASTAKDHFQKALRLSPLDNMAYRFYAGLAFSCLFLGQNDEAITWAYKGLHHNPKFTPTHRVLAAALSHAGRLDEAHQVIEQLRELLPDITVTKFGQETRFKHPEYFELLIDGLRKAGLPE